MASCLHKTVTERDALIASGWTLVSGPYPNEGVCDSSCGGGGGGGDVVCYECDCSKTAETGSTKWPSQWVFTVTGVTNGSCSECEDNLNGTHTIDAVNEGDPPVFGCAWDGPEATFCTDHSQDWLMQKNGPNVYFPSDHWELSPALSGGGMVYAIACEDFDPCGPNTLSKIIDSPECVTPWPHTITIYPVGDCSGPCP